jgi:hypothetical protein
MAAAFVFTLFNLAACHALITVDTLAGEVGVHGHADGQGTLASFYEPNGVALDARGTFTLVVSAQCRLCGVSPFYGHPRPGRFGQQHSPPCEHV